MLFQTGWLDHCDRVTEMWGKKHSRQVNSQCKGPKRSMRSLWQVIWPWGGHRGEVRGVACGSHHCPVGVGGFDYILNDREDHWISRGVTIWSTFWEDWSKCWVGHQDKYREVLLEQRRRECLDRKKWSDSAYALKAKPTEFADGLDVGVRKNESLEGWF